MYTNWNRFGKIISSIAFWLPAQLVVILLVEYFGLLPSNLSPGKSAFGGPAGGISNLIYSFCCCISGLIYTIVGSILIANVGLGTKKFWIWFSSLYGSYLIITLLGMTSAEGAWFNEGFGCYILDVWIAPLLWLGELFLAKIVYDSSRKLPVNPYMATNQNK